MLELYQPTVNMFSTLNKLYIFESKFRARTMGSQTGFHIWAYVYCPYPIPNIVINGCSGDNYLPDRFFLWVGCIIKFSSRHGIRADRKRGRHSETSPKDPPMGGAFWETPISKHIFPNFGSIIPNHLNISKTQILGALQSLTASVLLNL